MIFRLLTLVALWDVNWFALTVYREPSPVYRITAVQAPNRVSPKVALVTALNRGFRRFSATTNR